MKTRCLNKNSSIYNYYGGRGITVCDEWLNNPEIFIQWALNNGWKKELEIDRINNDGNYEPNNCRFVSRRKNCSNTRKQKNRKLPIGIKKSRNKFVAEIGMKGKKRYLGTFTTAIEAQEVREKFVLNNIL